MGKIFWEADPAIIVRLLHDSVCFGIAFHHHRDSIPHYRDSFTRHRDSFPHTVSTPLISLTKDEIFRLLPSFYSLLSTRCCGKLLLISKNRKLASNSQTGARAHPDRAKTVCKKWGESRKNEFAFLRKRMNVNNLPISSRLPLLL